MFDRRNKLEALLQSGYRYALSLCADETEAEDLVQEGWLRTNVRYGKNVRTGQFIRAIRNLYIDRYRRSKLVVLETLEEEPSGPELDRDVLPHEMDEALSTIRPEEREAIYLNVVEGYSAREIADLTDSSRNTVLSLIHRGKAKLADYFGGDIRKDTA